MAESIDVEVAFALPGRQMIVTLSVAQGTTAREAVTMAELPRHFPDSPAETFRDAALGIFGKRLRDPDQPLVDGDRVELYRSLTIDPKEARKRRASRRGREV